MLPHLLIEQSFPTPIAMVVCGLSSDQDILKITDRIQHDNGESVVFQTSSHTIELITFKQRMPLYNGRSVEDCKGWIWRITKDNADDETLELHCSLTDCVEGLTSGSDPGEHLDSIIADNKEWMLHIGTEDGEVMHFRALNDDWMPLRFKDRLGFSESFTHLQLNGMVTPVPELTAGERIHFHYLTAFDKYNEIVLNTWFAVDAFKRQLENWVGVW